MPSFSIAAARARMPGAEVCSERKSSSMMTMGKQNFMGAVPCRTRRRLLVATPSAGAHAWRAGRVKGANYAAIRKGWLPRLPTPHPGGRHLRALVSDLGQRDALLALIFAAAILVRGLADFVGLEEDHLRDALVGVNLRRQRGGVGELQRDKALPLGLEGRDVDDDAATGVRAFSETNREHVTRDTKVLNRAGKREGVWRNDAPITPEVDE